MALRFRIGSIPIHIHPFFFLTALLLGMGTNASVQTAAIWVATVFVSVLLHELGHALAGKVYGLAPTITLHGMGGTTSWTEASRRRSLGHGAQMFISFAGPLVGLLVGGATAAWWYVKGDPSTELGKELLGGVLFVNLGWSMFNLLPIVPLDGGQIMANGIAWVSRGRAYRLPHYVSIAFALAVGGAALYVRWFWVVLLSALYIHQNVRALRAAVAVQSETPRFDELAAGFKAIEEGNGHEAIRIAEALLASTRLVEVRLGALRLLAYGRLLEGQWGMLMQLLESARFELGPQELARFEQAARELERPDEATQIRSWLDNVARPEPEPSPFRA